MMGGPAFLSFSAKGHTLALRLREALGGTALCAHGAPDFSLTEWTRQTFAEDRDMVFVGAVGIAVRAVAPYLKSKATDPAVVAIDECGRFAVPVVSGHLGGANDLARSVAAICGATPVITTATDSNGLFAVDEWARYQNCRVPDPHGIKKVSSAILAGETVRVCSAWEVEGTPPPRLELGTREDCGILVTLHREDSPALALVPHEAVLGVGCRKGTPREAIEEAFAAFCRDRKLWSDAICCAATIDIKAEESGLLAFCAAHGWPLSTYSAEELNQVEGSFTASPFVAKITGVDNVCERSAVRRSGGQLIETKYAGGGVTLALALKPMKLNWRYQHE